MCVCVCVRVCVRACAMLNIPWSLYTSSEGMVYLWRGCDMQHSVSPLVLAVLHCMNKENNNSQKIMKITGSRI